MHKAAAVSDNRPMLWKAETRLVNALAALEAEPDAGERGSGLELFLAEMFGREHFRVEANFVADGRQIDLFATRGELRLLIEAKWTKRAAQHTVIDEMRARLEHAPPGVVGLVVSMAGFTKTVVERLERSANVPILLMDGHELREIVSYGSGLNSLVRLKLDHLARNRRVLVGSVSPSARPWLSQLPEASSTIVDLDGRVRPVWESTGEYSVSVVTPRLLDLESARDGGVRLDLQLGLRDADELIGLMTNLAQLGWLTPDGAWRIEQMRHTWSGLGPAELARQLLDWQGRYANRPMHHHEVVAYVDQSDDGMLTIAADVSATKERVVRNCELSFTLPGVPLDTTPYEGLTLDMPVLNTPTFSTLISDPAQIGRPRTRGRYKRLSPLAYIVRESSPFDREDDRRWVEGIITGDPMARASDIARLDAALPVPALGHVMVRLRQHHHLGDAVVYDLHQITKVGSRYLDILQLTGDWEAT